MMKWLKRLILYPILFIIVLVTLVGIFYNPANATLKGMYGSQLLWYGYEEKGNDMTEAFLALPLYQNAQNYRAQSVQNTKIGNYDEAIRYLDKAAELDPMNVDGYYGWVLLDYYRDYDKALFHLERLDSATDFVDYVSDYNILYAKALCYKQKREYDRAIDLFEQSINYEIEHHSEDWVTHQMYFQTGRTLQLMGRSKEAIGYYNKAIVNWNGSSESIYYKGLAEIELGLPDGCDNLKIALEKVKKGIKSSDMYVERFDEIYEGQVEKSIVELCE